MSIRVPIAACLLVAAVAALAAQSASSPTLDSAQQRELVRKIAALVSDEYVFPDRGRATSAALLERVASGAYDTPRPPADFASALTTELVALTHDKHSRVRYVESSTGAVTPSEQNPAIDNFGVHKIEWLPGRVGYLKIDRFYTDEESRPAFNAALTLLASASAIVIDLRDNVGGSDANNLLASYFFADRTFFNELTWRKMDPLEFWTDPSVRPQLPNVPLYILTSARTISAAEAFTYSLQQRRRATVVGERTAGAANPNRYFPLGFGLAVSISIGQTVNPVSKGNWEGTGVSPDVEVPASAALEAALARLNGH